MKADEAAIRKLIERPRSDIRLTLFLGPDDAGNAALARELAASYGADAEKVDLSGSQLKDDPARLADEAASLSLFGGNRYIMVTTSGEESLAAVRNLLEAESTANPVIIVASAISEKSHVGKAVIAAPNALCCISTMPSERDMTRIVADMAAARGLVMAEELAQRIGKYVGSNRKLAETEIEKLVLYLDAAPDSPKTVEPEMLLALGAANEDDAMQPIIHAALSGRIADLEDELRRMDEQGVSEVGLVIVMQRHVMQLVGLAARFRGGGDAGEFVEREFRARRAYGDKRAFREQLPRWSPAALSRLSERLLALQQGMMKASPGPDLLLRQELLEIARAASRRA
ncbi:MAG: DNA polymerase III subunit delta [Blastomonas sp.]